MYFDPYHDAIEAEMARLRASRDRGVLYDAHSILSHVPRLLDGELPQSNIGTFDGASCDIALTSAVAAVSDETSLVINERFKSGWSTRHYGNPAHGVHAIRIELAMHGYVDDSGPWPPVWDATREALLVKRLRDVLTAAPVFAG